MTIFLTTVSIMTKTTEWSIKTSWKESHYLHSMASTELSLCTDRQVPEKLTQWWAATMNVKILTRRRNLKDEGNHLKSMIKGRMRDLQKSTIFLTIRRQMYKMHTEMSINAPPVSWSNHFMSFLKLGCMIDFIARIASLWRDLCFFLFPTKIKLCKIQKYSKV